MISTWGATGGLKPAMSLNLLSGAISSLVSFTRATPGTVTDFEGLIKTVKSGEARFDGMRRVENLLSTSETLSTQLVTVIAGTYVFTLGATSTGSVTFSGASTGTLVGDGISRKYITLITTAGSLTITVTGFVLQAQLENVTGQTNQNPSEYVSTNVLSYPYQGAGVDGVQYFPYTNPNCVINGVITQIPTTPINSSNSKWAYNCTASGDYFSTPSSTANRITGNLSLLAQVALDDWTPGIVQTLVAKDGVSAGTRSWAFNVQTSGAPRLNYSLDGTNILSATATVATGFTDRTVHYVGVQRESSTGIIKFYTSEDGRTFTQLGSDVAGTAGALYDATTQPVQFGNLSGLSFALDGKIYDSHVYSGLKFTGTSTMVMDFDPSNWTTGTTFTGLETGEVWTLNGNAKIYQGLWDAVGPSSLLIEEARTNQIPYSQGAMTSAYSVSSCAATINNIIAPDGTVSAMKLQSTAHTGLATGVYLTTALTGNNTTFSIYAKAGTSRWIGLSHASGSTGWAYFDLLSGVPGYSAGCTPTMTAMGNGWYRCSLNASTFLGTTYCLISFQQANVNVEPWAGASQTFAGTENFYIWGAQLEAGSFATSPIITAGSQVTRNADQASMTGTNFSSWYNQAQGSFYVEADANLSTSTARGIFAVQDATVSSTNSISEYYDGNNVSTTYVLTKSGSSLMSVSTLNKNNKSAFVYGTNPIIASGGTTAASSPTVSPMPTVDRLYIGNLAWFYQGYLNGHIRKLSYYPVALPSAVLQALTS